MSLERFKTAQDSATAGFAQLDNGVQLVALMGGRTDALKVVSSLTLFQLAARRLASSGTAAAELAEIEVRCENVLAIAATQGFPPCAFTLASLARVC